MKMFTNVLCDPPLGQSTVIPRGKNSVNFTVLIESIASSSDRPWEAVLWHNCTSDGEWMGVDLAADSSNSCLSIMSKDRPNAHQKYFKGTIHKPSNLDRECNFTLKYRPDPRENWRWANENLSLADGQLIFQGESSGYPWLIFPDMDPAIVCKRVTSDTPDTKLWYMSHSVPASGRNSGYSTTSIGKPAKLSRFFALTRLWTPWLIPEHGKTVFDISKDAIICSFLRYDGLHVVLLAVSGLGNLQTVFKSSESGDVLIHSRNDDTSPAHGSALLGLGYSQETALAACTYYARRLVGNFDPAVVKEPQLDVSMEDGVDANWYVEWADGLTYCTWNSLGKKLTEEKLLDAIEGLKKNNLIITNLIIDDNWQTVKDAEKYFDRGLLSFEANKEGFPDGLKETLSRIKRIMPRIQTIAVWHAILGYWGGISPSGELAKKYRTKEVKRAAMEMPGYTHPASRITVVDEPDVQRMYNDFYSFLESAGISAVKTDGQFLLDQLDAPQDRRSLMKTYQDVWDQVGLRHFQSKQISCMSQVPDIIFHSQLLPNKPPIMVRNSDDFFPDSPDSHAWHIFTNAYTATFTQYLNVIPDWDMFQTKHPYGSYHAAARCISGGPLYFTDKPGEHDLGLFAQFSAKTTQGDLVALRPSRVARTIESQVYYSYDGKWPVKIGTYNGGKGVGTGILGIFNIGAYAVSDFVSLKEFPGVESGEEYIIRAYSTGQVTSQIKKGSEDGPVTNIFLPHKGWDILTAYPLQHVPEFGVHVASLGLLGKMSGQTATLRFDVQTLPDDRLEMDTNLKALGVLGLYISNLESKTVLENFMVTIQGEVVPVSTVAKSDEDTRVLTIDVERAWKELNMHAGWGNELAVKVLMS